MAAILKNYVLVVCLVLLSWTNISRGWEAEYGSNLTTITLHMEKVHTINVTLTGLDAEKLINANVTLDSNSTILGSSNVNILDDITDKTWTGTFNVSAIFLGTANIHVKISLDGHDEFSNQTLGVVIIREKLTIDKVFNGSVIALVFILYINFGAALDLTKVREILVRPIGPLMAFVCKFLFMPLLSYFLGLFLFPDNVEMQLGMFFTGVSPSGGASNVWSVLLGGNLDLSISMTTINTIAAFVMMPLWIFTLGSTIFDRGHLTIPYARIASMAIGLVVPLSIGLLIQRFLPRLAKMLVRILKTFSSLLIIFIIIFAIVTNFYLFELFTWQIFVAGLLLPWIAYIIGWIVATLFKQKHEDSVAISIESGVQNTGIAIYILHLALQQPQGDLTTVIPVSVAIMTPIPLLFYFIYLKGKDRFSKHRHSPVPTNPPVAFSAVANK